MIRRFWIGPAALLLLGTGIAFGQGAPSKSGGTKTPPASSNQGTTGQGMMGQGHMGGGMMGQGMMSQDMMENCQCGANAGVRIDVKKVAKGVTITYTSDDASTVTRLQKRAEATRLMQESCNQ